MASKGRMGIQGLAALPAKAPKGFNGQQRPDGDSGGQGNPQATIPVRFQWPAKAGWGFRLVCRTVVQLPLCFNGQQRPDGDSGPSYRDGVGTWVRSFNGQQRPDGDSGGRGGRGSHRGRVSMASKGRMGIQVRSVSMWGVSPSRFNGQQRPDGDSGDYLPLQAAHRPGVSMASKGRMGIQDGVGTGRRSHPQVSMASKGRMGIQARLEERKRTTEKFQWPAKAGWGFRLGMCINYLSVLA